MPKDIEDILKKYWGHSSFRPLQEEIIRSVISGVDTIALLPTGGGKSVCFQVPAMAMEGVCIVVSPLIALMRDQVQMLKQKGISAIAINSTLSKKEIDYALDNAVYGKTKFIYLSPERLKSDIVLARVAKMKVSILAIDEAHCISQWGHDFRPAYKQIAEFKEHLPKGIPTIALTATAVPEVIDEISESLEMESPKLFQKSFVRDNLIYVVQDEGQKLSRVQNVIKRLGGTGILYVPTRRETVSQAKLLRANGIGAVAYHGGMEYKDRQAMQDLWVNNKAQVMVSTNAFGMGIDKSDVRFVIHTSIPQNIEAYFQEAGRAGRDGQLAYAVALVNEKDREDLKARIEEMIPTLSEIKQTYRALTNYLQLAMGSTMYFATPFDVPEFSKKYGFKLKTTYRALRQLEISEVITLSDAFHNPSTLQILMRNKDLYSFEIGNPQYEDLIHLLLRSYEGIFEQTTRINENNIAVRLKVSAGDVKKQLRQLEAMRVIRYQEQTDLPFISFQKERPTVEELKIDNVFIKKQKERYTSKMNAIIDYTRNDVVCRSVQLVSYFGDHSAQPCGKCDVCLSQKETGLSAEKFQQIKAAIWPIIESNDATLDKLIESVQFLKKDIISVVQILADEREIQIDPNNALSLTNP